MTPSEICGFAGGFSGMYKPHTRFAKNPVCSCNERKIDFVEGKYRRKNPQFACKDFVSKFNSG
jgi:hypothetical protein